MVSDIVGDTVENEIRLDPHYPSVLLSSIALSHEGNRDNKATGEQREQMGDP